MPFGSYQESKEQAFRNAAQIMCETGCQAVKLEGGEELADTVCFLAERGVPVFGHVGLRPQNMHTAGGFRRHGKEHGEAIQIVNDAKAIADAGAFAIVVEGTVEPVAARELLQAQRYPLRRWQKHPHPQLLLRRSRFVLLRHVPCHDA